MNYNRFLTNSQRSELIGKNMSTVCVNEFSRDRQRLWRKPEPLMQGTLCMGHELDVSDALTIAVTESGCRLEFDVMRHEWTPAWIDTHYRCAPEIEYYPNSGCIALRERKCITRGDVFVSELTFMNDKKQPVRLDIAFESPFEALGDGMFRAEGRTVPAALHAKYRLSGCFCLAGAPERMALELPAGGRARLRAAFAFGHDGASARERANAALAAEDAFGENERSLNRWFDENVPALKCDDIELVKAYYYRCLLVDINTFAPAEVFPDHHISGRAMYESRYGSWFGAPIGLPLPLQANEARWLDPRLAAGQLALLKDRQHVSMYINNAPASALNLYRLTGDRGWLGEIYGLMRDFTLEKCSSPGELPVTTGSWVVGAEHQPSFYQHTDPPWDWRHDSSGRKLGFQPATLYRLDEISYYAQNLRACADMARILGRDAEAARLSELYEAVRARLESEFWNERDGMFYDIDNVSGRQCDLAACYDSFAPFMGNVIDGARYGRSFDRLMDEDWFADEFSAVSVAKNCAMYWFDNCIVGPTAASVAHPHEYGACWNGPIWPYAVTMMLCGLGDYAARHPERRAQWLELFSRFTSLHFHDGDRSTPCITEHYRPGDGRSFSSAADYFHSAYVDLLIRYWAGIDADGEQITFDPFTREEFELRNVRLLGRTYTFRQRLSNGKLTAEYCIS